jgi:hypothetical protein
MDDEKLVYPAYQKMLDTPIRNICVHKGLFPPSPKLIISTGSSGNTRQGRRAAISATATCSGRLDQSPPHR